MVMLSSSSYPGRHYSFVTSALSVVVVALSCFGSIAFADTYTFNNFQVDRNYSFFFDDFWFTKDQGQLLLNVSNISFSNPNPASFNLSQLGFFLLSRNYSTHHSDYMYTACSLHSHHIPSKILYTFDNLVQPSSSPNKNLTTKTSFDILITDIDADDVYDLYLQNCISPRGQLTLSMTVQISMYNFDPKTGHKSYLSSTKSLFPRLYLLCILVYFSLGCLWACFLYKNIKSVCRIHVSMLMVVILKALSSLLELMNVYYLSVTGCAQCSTCVVLTYMSEFLNGTPLITLMILIFIGWSYMKPSLSYCEITMLVLLVCFRAAVIYGKTIGLGARGTSPFFRSLWASVFTLYDSQLVVFLLVSAISSVVMFLHDARKAHGKATLIFKRVKQFRLLFIVFVLNCVYNVALCRLEFSTKPTHYLWSFVALKEIGTVILYVFIGYLFRPDGVMLSMPITDDEEKAAYESLNTSPARYLQYMTGFKSQLPNP